MSQRVQVSRRVAGAGMAGVAAAFAMALPAHADAAPAADATSQTHDTSAKPATRIRAGAVVPNYGTQKIRVGVQEKAGGYYPAGTNTGGTKISIKETGPNADLAATVYGDSCTTVPNSEQPPQTETFCDFTDAVPTVRRNASLQKRLDAIGLNARAFANGGITNYLVFPGDTVTFQQTTVNANLLIDPDPQSFGPCTAVNPGIQGQGAQPASAVPECSQTPVEIAFTDAGLPPKAKNDSRQVKSGGSMQIDVLGNDTTAGADASVAIITQPGHGTAKVVNEVMATTSAKSLKAATKPVIVYTPDSGFYGTDSLRYRLTTANGSSVATVTLRVAAAPTANDDSVSIDAGTAVTVDVLANDAANGGGALSVASVGAPGHGTAKIENGKVVYTPDADFAGTDTFTYVAATSIGTDTATVTVTVNAVANTGSQTGELLGIAALLMVTGGAATVAGRRRYRARHTGGA